MITTTNTGLSKYKEGDGNDAIFADLEWHEQGARRLDVYMLLVTRSPSPLLFFLLAMVHAIAQYQTRMIRRSAIRHPPSADGNRPLTLSRSPSYLHILW